jgi:hypothetical protein
MDDRNLAGVLLSRGLLPATLTRFERLITGPVWNQAHARRPV